MKRKRLTDNRMKRKRLTDNRMKRKGPKKKKNKK